MSADKIRRDEFILKIVELLGQPPNSISMTVHNLGHKCFELATELHELLSWDIQANIGEEHAWIILTLKHGQSRGDEQSRKIISKFEAILSKLQSDCSDLGVPPLHFGTPTNDLDRAVLYFEFKDWNSDDPAIRMKVANYMANAYIEIKKAIQAYKD